MAHQKDITLDPHSLTGQRDRTGTSGTQEWDVVAFSEVEAFGKLADQRQVDYGKPYRDVQGNTPNPNITYQQFSARVKSPASLAGPGLWRVTTNYGPPELFGGGGGSNERPEVGAPVYRWSRASQTIPAEIDRKGKLIANTRGEPFDPGVGIYIPSRVLTIRWIVPDYNLSFLLGFDGAVNLEPWYIKGRWRIEPGQVLVEGIDPEERGEFEAELTGTFRFRPLGELWHPFTLPSYTVEEGVRKYLDEAGDVVEDPELAFRHKFDLYDPVSFEEIPGRVGPAPEQE